MPSDGYGLYQRIREVNRAGRLYPLPEPYTFEHEAFIAWEVAQLLWYIPATATSPPGYVAVGTTGIAALRREWQS